MGQPDDALNADELRALIDEDPTGLRMRSVVSLFDFEPAQIRTVLDVAEGLKHYDLARERSLFWSYPRTLALVFEKPSLRTRVSFEAGMAHLQGATIYLAPGDIGLGKREAVEDVAGALSRWVDIIAARVFKHETVEELVTHGTIPVINALSDREHPIQAFADLLTLQEQKGGLGNHIKLAYIGDGNNILHALLLACSKMGVHLTAACPDGYGPLGSYLEEAERISTETGSIIRIVTDPAEAVENADAIYTDVWASMGQEEEQKLRAQVFSQYQVNRALVDRAKPDVIVMHDLPAHRGEEITADVMDTYHTVIMDQAENRLHTQKALLALILGM